MPLGIKPTVDFAFKKIFGSPENSLALIGLLNAILDLERPIEAVEILNPFNYQEFAGAKQIVLDVRCRDTAGRWLNVEMQISAYGGILERLVYYACSMYVDQLTAGGSYSFANPAISICLLGHPLFRDTEQAHHRFQMLDTTSGRVLENAIEVHTVELTKYNLDEATIATRPKLDQWVFLLLHAQDYDSTTLNRLLPGIEFKQAIQTIEAIAVKTEDKFMYDQREKAQRDYEWAVSGAREEGREEGKLAGKIQMLQEILGERISADSELMSRSQDMLREDLNAMQERLRRRKS